MQETRFKEKLLFNKSIPGDALLSSLSGQALLEWILSLGFLIPFFSLLGLLCFHQWRVFQCQVLLFQKTHQKLYQKNKSTSSLSKIFSLWRFLRSSSTHIHFKQTKTHWEGTLSCQGIQYQVRFRKLNPTPDAS